MTQIPTPASHGQFSRNLLQAVGFSKNLHGHNARWTCQGLCTRALPTSASFNPAGVNLLRSNQFPLAACDCNRSARGYLRNFAVIEVVPGFIRVSAITGVVTMLKSPCQAHGAQLSQGDAGIGGCTETFGGLALRSLENGLPKQQATQSDVKVIRIIWYLFHLFSKSYFKNQESTCPFLEKKPLNRILIEILIIYPENQPGSQVTSGLEILNLCDS